MQDEQMDQKFQQAIRLCEVNSQQLQEFRASFKARSDALEHINEDTRQHFANKIDVLDSKYERVTISQEHSIKEAQLQLVQQTTHLDKRWVEYAEAQSARIQNVATASKRQYSHLTELLESVDHKCAHENADQSSRNQIASKSFAEELTKHSEICTSKISYLEEMVWHISNSAVLRVC